MGRFSGGLMRLRADQLCCVRRPSTSLSPPLLAFDSAQAERISADTTAGISAAALTICPGVLETTGRNRFRGRFLEQIPWLSCSLRQGKSPLNGTLLAEPVGFE